MPADPIGSSTDPAADRARLDGIMRGYQLPVILLSIAHLGVFAALGRERKTAAQLAAELALDRRALETVLLVLVAEGLLDRSGEAFVLPPALAPLLLPGEPETLSSIIAHNYHCLQRWVDLAEVVRSGRPSTRAGRRDQESLRAFILGMENISRRSSVEVAERFDLSSYRRMLDLGGGPGTSSLTFARANPRLTCVVFDLPEVVPIAREQIERAGLGNRVSTRAGDYLVDDLGEGYDLVYVSNIVHSLPPAGVARLTERIARILPPDGTILLKDFFLEDDRLHPAAAARFSVNMLVATDGGRSYTFAEMEDILAGAGFTGFARQPVATSSALLSARRPR
jgi:SAM-dependent methyltransferase